MSLNTNGWDYIYNIKLNTLNNLIDTIIKATDPACKSSKKVYQ